MFIFRLLLYIYNQWTRLAPDYKISADRKLMNKLWANLMPKKQNDNQMDVQNPQAESYMPWVQKQYLDFYSSRPNSLDQLSYQTQVTSALKSIVKTGNIPHLLFYGPAGTGKTSAIVAMAKQIFGAGFYKQRIIQLNASDERGINVIRQKVKTFAQKAYRKNPDKNANVPKVKIIILDEADLLTNDAQSALRRIIQDNSGSTRFCIICNYITKIIQPLASRCIKFRFKSIPTQVQFNKLAQICQKQKVPLNRKDLQILVEKGDLRQSINSLQSLSKLTSISSNILPVSNQYCENLFDKIMKSQNMRQVYQLAQQVTCEGYAIDQIINGLFNCVLKLSCQKTKAILLEQLSKTGQQLQLGVCQLPLIDLFTSLHYVLNLQI